MTLTRILITGVAGLIGSHLAEKLLIEGKTVVGLDNFQSGSPENIETLLMYNEFEFIEHDVTQPYFVETDFIYNLACPASPVHYQNDPVGTVRTNVLGAINALELARELKCGVLQASTSEIYGDPLVSPQPETYLGNVNPIGIRACYDEGKRVAETLFFDYYRQYDVKIKIARIFNTYGPKMRVNDGRVISNLIVQALSGQNLSLYGDGSQTRSFCYVTDLVEGLIRFSETNENQTGPLNLGNPNEFTILELAELIQELTFSKSSFAFSELPQDDPKVRKPDISLAFEQIHWSPNTQLREGLIETINDFRTRLSKTEE
jgi:UDP-glucuronate decarboxylase